MNLEWFQYLNGLAGNDLQFDVLVIFFAKYFGLLLLAGLGAYLLFKQKRRDLKMALFALTSAFVARVIFTEIIRLFYFHPRPFMFLSEVQQLVFHEPSASFPSGHVAFFIALAAGILFFNRFLGILFFFGAFLIGVSRVIVGIHWPYDIIGGAVVGIVSVILLWYLGKRLASPPLVEKETERDEE